MLLAALLAGLAVATLAACRSADELLRPAATVLVSPTPQSITGELAYVHDDGVVWLVNVADGRRRQLSEAGACGQWPHLIWSSTGHRLMCLGGVSENESRLLLMDADGTLLAEQVAPLRSSISWSPDGRYFLSVGYESDGSTRLALLDDMGRTVRDLGYTGMEATVYAWPHGGSWLWSPDGGAFAYWNANADEARIFDVDSMTERQVGQGTRPMGWALNGRALLVASSYRPPVGMGYPSYAVSLLDLGTQRLTRVPELDDGVQFWIAPDGETAVYLPKERRPDGLPSLAVLDLRTGSSRPIPNSVITYGSDHIPRGFVKFTTDGRALYWVSDVTEVFRYDLTDEAAQVEALGGREFVQLAPDPRFVVHQAIEGSTVILYVARADGTGLREIARVRASPRGAAFFSVAWRPGPQ